MFFVDVAYYGHIPRAIRHLVRLVSIMTVYVIGFYSKTPGKLKESV